MKVGLGGPLLWVVALGHLSGRRRDLTERDGSGSKTGVRDGSGEPDRTGILQVHGGSLLPLTLYQVAGRSQLHLGSRGDLSGSAVL